METSGRSWAGTPSACLASRPCLPLLLCGLLAGLAAGGSGRGGDERPRTGLCRVRFDGLPVKRDCWVYLPKRFDKTKRYPLVVVLHPAGLRGHRFAKIWGEVADHADEFIVLAPECGDEKKRLWKLADEALVLGTLKRAIEVFPSIDSTRVLLTGFSQGANYAYTFGLRNPAHFRAIAVASGALAARPSPQADEILRRAASLPVYICHGALDRHVPVQRARAARDRLEKFGYRVAYREVPQLGHFYPPREAERIWAWFKLLAAEPKRAPDAPRKQ